MAEQQIRTEFFTEQELCDLRDARQTAVKLQHCYARFSELINLAYARFNDVVEQPDAVAFSKIQEAVRFAKTRSVCFTPIGIVDRWLVCQICEALGIRDPRLTKPIPEEYQRSFSKIEG